jgi:hypothetical protein
MTSRISVVAVRVALLVAVLTGVARADGPTCLHYIGDNRQCEGKIISGYAGSPAQQTYDYCFVEDWGGVRNRCSTEQNWYIQLPVNSIDGRVDMTVMVSFWAPTSAALPRCTLYRVDEFGGSDRSQAINAPGAGKTSDWRQFSVEQGQSAYLYCTIPTDCQVKRVMYSAWYAYTY